MFVRSASAQRTHRTHFEATPGARPLPNQAQLEALDPYHKMLREKAKTHTKD